MTGAVLSLKDNIDMVRDELNSEEKFFENAVKTERFVKKYKNALIGSVVAVVVLVAGSALYDANQNKTVEAANTAFVALQKNSSDELAKKELQELNPALYDVWALSNAIAQNDAEALKKLASSKAVAVSDIASYELAASENDAGKLEKYSLRHNAIYKDLALVESAVLLMEKNEIDAAREKLNMIAPESSVYKVSRVLLHYGAK